MQAVAILIMFIGVMFFGFLVSSLGELLSTANEESKRGALLRKKLEDVEIWAKYRGVPKTLRRKVNDFYSQACSSI